MYVMENVQDGRGRLWRRPHRRLRTPWPKQLRLSSLRLPAGKQAAATCLTPASFSLAAAAGAEADFPS